MCRMCVFVYVVCVCGVSHTHAMANMRRPGDNFVESVLSFYHRDPRTGTQTVRLRGKQPDAQFHHLTDSRKTISGPSPCWIFF